MMGPRLTKCPSAPKYAKDAAINSEPPSWTAKHARSARARKKKLSGIWRRHTSRQPIVIWKVSSQSSGKQKQTKTNSKMKSRPLANRTLQSAETIIQSWNSWCLTMRQQTHPTIISLRGTNYILDVVSTKLDMSVFATTAWWLSSTSTAAPTDVRKKKKFRKLRLINKSKSIKPASFTYTP